MRSIRGGSAVECANTNDDVATDDCVQFAAAAQQLSACAWPIVRVEPKRCDADLCIGQLVPIMQHAIRASAVACHPAHTLRLPPDSVRIAATAAMRLAKRTTYVGC